MRKMQRSRNIFVPDVTSPIGRPILRGKSSPSRDSEPGTISRHSMDLLSSLGTSSVPKLLVWGEENTFQVVE